MMLRTSSRTLLACAFLLVTFGASQSEAKYRYGSYSSGGDERGFFVSLEAALANPRSTDVVVATVEEIENFGGGVNTVTPVLPVWDDEFAGRLRVGYAWASGNKISVAFWNFSADQSAAGDGPAGGVTHFAIGPPIFTGSEYVGANGSPGHFNLATEIDATTAEVAWSKSNEIVEPFTLEWSVAARYANYEEMTSGLYDEAGGGDAAFGQFAYLAAKSTQADFFGVRAGIRGSYRLTERFSVDGGLGFSFMDGELDASSSLTPAGTANSATVPTAQAFAFDDGRSGTQREVEATIVWHSAGDAFRLWFGWEQSVWEGIPTDLLRNFPGTSAPLRERDTVVFSGYKLGLFFRF